MDENIRKAVALVFCVIGFGIFYLIIMTKIEVWAAQTNATVLQVSNELAWQNYLMKRTSLAIEPADQGEETDTEETAAEDVMSNAILEEKE